MKRKMGAGLFLVYSAGMLYLLFFQRIGGHFAGGLAEYIKNYGNLRPFYSIGAAVKSIAAQEPGMGLELRNLLGNIVLFIPLGLFLPGLFRAQRRFSVFLPTVALLILAVELLQVLTMLGSADVDDLLLNCAGASLGFAGFRRFTAIRGRAEK